MKLTEFVVREAIVPELTSTAKSDVVREMVLSLGTSGLIADGEIEAVVQSILKREEQGTTGIGRGVAVPHTKHANATKLIGTVAVSKRGIEFDSLDGEPVHILFLLVSPPEPPRQHLQALETIAKHLRNDTFCRFLRQATTREQIVDVLDDADGNQLGT